MYLLVRSAGPSEHMKPLPSTLNIKYSHLVRVETRSRLRELSQLPCVLMHQQPAMCYDMLDTRVTSTGYAAHVRQ